MKERWFAGAHTNVGGGYEDAGLSTLAWLWMWDQAKGIGLDFAPPHWPMPQVPNALGEVRDSFGEFWEGIPPIGDLMRRHSLAQKARRLRPGQRVRPSVFERIAKAQPAYRPLAQLPEGLAWETLPEAWKDPELP